MEHEESIKRNQAVEDKHLRMAVFSEPAILVNLGQLYQPSIDAVSLYEVMRSLVKVSGWRVKKIRLVCAVYTGFIKEVYVVSRWSRAHLWGSYSFEGETAPDELREKYVGRSVAAYWGPSDRALIKYATYMIKDKKYKS
jgi:hypothetical protein